MRLLPLLALLAAALGSAPTRAQPAGETIVILDLSGSMWGRIGQETKLDIAREAVRGMFSRFPADSRVGLMAFGHRQARAERVPEVAAAERAGLPEQARASAPGRRWRVLRWRTE